MAIKYKPDYVDGYYNLGIALGTSGKFDEAIQAYEMAIKLESDHAPSYYNLGITFDK